MTLPLSVKLSQSQVNEMRDWCTQYGKSVPQKTVRGMSIKDNPGTLPINLYASKPATPEPVDFCASISTINYKAATPEEIVYTSGAIVFEEKNNKIIIHKLDENIKKNDKKGKTIEYKQNAFDPLCFYAEKTSEIQLKDVEGPVNNFFFDGICYLWMNWR